MAAAAPADTSKKLTERANDILTAFDSSTIFAFSLRQELFERASGDAKPFLAASHGAGYTENLTQMTTLSDGAFSIDPNDLQALQGDLETYKTYFSQLKFNWMESNIKRRFVQHILADDAIPFTLDSQALDSERMAKKAELKGSKTKVDEIRAEIAEVSTILSAEINEVTAALEETKTLTRQIEDMELELAMARNSEERMTVAEAEDLLDTQVVQLQNLASSIDTAKSQVAVAKARLAEDRAEIEALQVEKIALAKREKEARASVKDTDNRVQTACQVLNTSTSLFKELLGIHSVQTIGNPPSEMRLTWDLSAPTDETDKLATLSITLAPSGALIGARLIDSNLSIQDLYEARKQDQDVQLLVRQVLARLSS